MKAEIISTGTELLLGDVIDTNTPYLARKLAAIGVNVYHHTTVGDNSGRLLEAIKTAEQRTDVVVISGGLGPTQDDITKFMLADYLGHDLVLDQESHDKMQKRYQLNEISEGNYRQALVIEGSQVLHNDNGMAPGIFLEKDKQFYALLPGPPNEFELMVDTYLIPKLAKVVSGDNILRSRNLNFYGIPEASVAEILYDVIEQQSNPTVAIYANEGSISVRLTASAKTEAECQILLEEKEKEVLAELDPYFFGYEDITLHDIIFSKFSAKQQTVASLEVMTKGALIESWSDTPGNLKVYKGGKTFNSHKEAVNLIAGDVLHESTKTLNEFYATHIKSEFQTDYGVAVSRVSKDAQATDDGENIFWMSLALPNGEVVTRQADYSYRTYMNRWRLSLRVSDFIRRELYQLIPLDEIKVGKRE